MWLTRVFIKRPTLVFVFIALTLIAAVMACRRWSFRRTRIAACPASRSASGYRRIDQRAADGSGVAARRSARRHAVPRHPSTTIESGSVSIAATFSLESTTPENIANVEKAIQSAQRQLPASISPPTLRVANPSEPVIVTLALLRTSIRKPISERLRTTRSCRRSNSCRACRTSTSPAQRSRRSP